MFKSLPGVGVNPVKGTARGLSWSSGALGPSSGRFWKLREGAVKNLPHPAKNFGPQARRWRGSQWPVG